MKFINKETPVGIAVEGQDLEVEFAFMGPVESGEEETYTNLSYWSVCRDFLGDTICATVDKKTVGIYGFSHDGKNNPIIQERTMLGMKFPNAATLRTFKRNFMKYKPWIVTTVSPARRTMNCFVFEEDLVVMVTADKVWQQTTVGISLLSFILKGLCWSFEENLENPIDAIASTEKEINKPTKEARYVLGFEKEVTELLKNLKRLTAKHKYVHGWPNQDEHISRVHNNSGFFYAVKWKQDTVVGKWFKEQAAQ